MARAFNRAYDLKLTTRGEMEFAYLGEITTPSKCGACGREGAGVGGRGGACGREGAEVGVCGGACGREGAGVWGCGSACGSGLVMVHYTSPTHPPTHPSLALSFSLPRLLPLRPLGE